MKILHTADWHLGKKLYKKDLTEEHNLFFGWLIETIKAREIDLLLISGDVFDSANPPNEARQLYYGFLAKMVLLNCRIIITGGNHDAPSMLDAPRELLAMLNISIVGGVPENKIEMLLPFPPQNPDIVIAAIPYLRDSEIRQAIDNESFDNKIEAMKQGIRTFYDNVAEQAKNRFPTIPLLAMGHLYARGVTTSDSEREIQIGNLASFDANDFSADFVYVALGHIHRPQQVGNSGRVRYSGSPISLSFSEKNDIKIVIEICFENQQIVTIEPLQVPQFRQLRHISGSFEEVKKQLINFKNQGQLKAFIEIEVKEQNYNPLLTKELNDIISVFENEEAEILKHRIGFENTATGADELFVVGQAIDEISERDVLLKRLEFENALGDDDRQMIMEAFDELLQELYEAQ